MADKSQTPTTPDFLAQDVADIATIEQQIKDQPPADDEPAPAQEAEPQQPPAVEDEEKDDGEDRGQFVRKAALYDERRRRKEATERSRQSAQELDQERRRFSDFQAKANERLATLFANAQRQNDPQQAEPVIPPLEQDPLAHLTGRLAQTEKQLQEANEWRKSQETRVQQSDQAVMLQQEVGRLEQQFAQQNADYYDAQAYLAEQWAKEAQAIGFDPRQAIQARIIETVQIGARMNVNPAEVAYKLAKQRGYAAQAKPNGSQPAPQPQPRPQGVNLDTLQKGLDASKSPSSTPGAAVAGTPTIEALLAMDDDEFAREYVTTEAGQKKFQRELMKRVGIG